MPSGAITESRGLDEAGDATLRSRWTPAHRFGFRFAFIYLALYLQVAIVLNFPALHPVVGFWNSITPWVARHWSHLTSSHLTGTSGGDTAAEYLQCLCMLVLATVGGIVWSFLDHKRAHYVALHEWLRSSLGTSWRSPSSITDWPRSSCCNSRGHSSTT